VIDYLTPLRALRADLNLANRPAVLNRQEINPPCLFIALRGLDQFTFSNDCAEAALYLYLIIGDRQDEAALEALQPHLAALLDQMTQLGLPIELLEADQVRTTETDTALPAFRLETHMNV
jgi:hypothetical protein